MWRAPRWACWPAGSRRPSGWARAGGAPPTTALGALIGHITGGHLSGPDAPFQPMNVNYGLFPPMEAPRRDEAGAKIPNKERGRAKKRLMSLRAMADLELAVAAPAVAAE